MNYGKYHNRKTTVDGITFDSKKEAERYQVLKMLERAGQISDLRRQVRYELIPSQKLPKPIERVGYSNKYSETAIIYIADFVYKDKDGNEIVEDVKGMRTGEYVIKRKLMLYVHGIQIKEV